MDSNSTATSCINCGHTINNAFCEKCGQRAQVNRMSFKEGWLDFWSRLYGFDGMLPRTLRDLTLRPGLVAREFIRGVRVKYYGPVGYFFLMVTLLLLLFSITGLSFGTLIEETQRSFAMEDKSKHLTTWMNNFISSNVKSFMFLGIPFVGLVARYLFYRKSGYRLIEHMVLPFYLSGHLLWITMLIVLVKYFFGIGVHGYSAILSLLFYGYGYMTWIDQNSKIKTFLKGAGIYILGHLLFAFSIGLMAYIGVMLVSYFDPETFDLIKTGNGSLN